MKRIDITSLLANKKRMLIVGVAAVLLVLLGIFAYSQYRLINPKVEKYQPPSALEGISEVDENYSDLTKEQIDLQLERQIGTTAASLQEKDIKKSTFKSYADAYKAAHALWAYGNQQKSLDAYAAAAAFDDPNKTYGFYLDYAYIALQIDRKDVAKEQLASAKPGVDALTVPESKQEAVSKYEYLSVLANKE